MGAVAAETGGRRRRPAARTKMPRDSLAQGLEAEATLAAEVAWKLREAVASMAAGSLDMDVDSPPHLSIETLANQVILDGEEEHSLEVPAAANPLEDSSDRMNRLIVMQKRLLEAQKRKRSISSVHTSNSVHVSFFIPI
ncbi:uncharacterized protein LOC120680709 isoform X2 [Panicum virgatum]|uniref:uncharacterized protein LOC120680709 isoform X2 n=1 Tax=Panicum virgatum TaxID=38727 RepID=UPI0019D681B2|nr:uncharacterized protein LOC120680709 isoform X2 [Panicum virgatum]